MSILKKDPSTPPVDEGCFLVTVHNVKVADFVNDAELQEHTCYIHLPESLYPVEYKLYRSPKNMLEVGT